MGTMEGPSMDDGHLKESARTKKKKKGAWSKIKAAVASIARLLTHLNNLDKYSRGQRMVKELRQEEEMAMKRALEESMRDEFTGPAAATSREDQMQLEASRKLREEQDREYEEALKADRKREEAQTKNEQFREEVPEEEEEVEEKREEKKKEEQPSLPIEPEAVATMGTTSDLQKPPEPESVINEASLDDELNNPEREVTLAIRLPGGQRLQSQFRADNTIGDVRRFVDSIMLKEERENVKEEGPFLLEDYDLVGSWPPSPHFSDLKQTLADAGLYPRALLCVQERI